MPEMSSSTTSQQDDVLHAHLHRTRPTPPCNSLYDAHTFNTSSLNHCTLLDVLQCSFFEHRAYKVVYRRYASLFFMVGVDAEEVGWEDVASYIDILPLYCCHCGRQLGVEWMWRGWKCRLKDGAGDAGLGALLWT